MSVVKHNAYSAAVVALTAGLDAMANGARVLSPAQDNTANLDLSDDLELVVTFGSAPVAGKLVDVYLVPSVDGTNYADGDSSTEPPSNFWCGAFAVRAVTTAQRLACLDVRIPPGKFKYLLKNNTGQAFAATGNTFTRRPHNLQD